MTNTTRAAYPHFHRIATRWRDNDVYGHVNNVVYYSYFDTVINSYLMTAGGFDFERDASIGLCVRSHCDYKISVAFPEAVDIGLRAAKIGRTSVTWELAIFKDGGDQLAAACTFVHVFVDRETRRPAPIPDKLRAAIRAIEGDEART